MTSTYLSVRSLTSTWIMADDYDRFKTVWKLPGLLWSLKIMLFTFVTCFKCILYLSLVSTSSFKSIRFEQICNIKIWYFVSKKILSYQLLWGTIGTFLIPFQYFTYPIKTQFLALFKVFFTFRYPSYISYTLPKISITIRYFGNCIKTQCLALFENFEFPIPYILMCDNYVPQWWVELVVYYQIQNFLSYLQKIAKSFTTFLLFPFS